MNSNSSSVLIIDDDRDILMTITAYLEDSGYIVYVAMDGEEGLKLFKQKKPDIVVTDLRMPRLDGFGVLAALKAANPATQVIVVTGTAGYHTTEQLKSLGAFCCLYKPIHDLQDLVAAIEKALDKSGKGVS